MAKNYVRIGDTIGAWIDKNNDLVNRVGDLALLQTSAAADSCIVFAVNELHADALFDSARLDSAETRLDGVDSNLDSDIGVRTSLTTNDKTDLVTAINEVNKLATYFATFQDSDLIIGKDSDANTSHIVIADSSVTVEGNLRIRGTIFEQERFNDRYIVLQQGITADSRNDAGIDIERGNQTNARLTWNETTDYWTAGLQGAEKRILTDSDRGILIASKDSVDQGQDSNKALIDSANAYFKSLVDSNFSHFNLLLDSSDGQALSINNSTAKIDSNAALGTFLKNFDRHNRYVIGDSNMTGGLHIPSLNNLYATGSTTLSIYGSDSSLLKRIIGFTS